MKKQTEKNKNSYWKWVFTRWWFWILLVSEGARNYYEVTKSSSEVIELGGFVVSILFVWAVTSAFYLYLTKESVLKSYLTKKLGAPIDKDVDLKIVS